MPNNEYYEIFKRKVDEFFGGRESFFEWLGAGPAYGGDPWSIEASVRNSPIRFSFRFGPENSEFEYDCRLNLRPYSQNFAHDSAVLRNNFVTQVNRLYGTGLVKAPAGHSYFQPYNQQGRGNVVFSLGRSCDLSQRARIGMCPHFDGLVGVVELNLLEAIVEILMRFSLCGLRRDSLLVMAPAPEINSNSLKGNRYRPNSDGKQIDVQQMVKVYRAIRKRVYEEATKPLSGDSRQHTENKRIFRAKVEEICSDANLKNYKNSDPVTVHRMWFHLWSKIRYAGIRTQIATNEVNSIAPIFNQYENFCDARWDIESSGHKLIRGGDFVHDFIGRTGAFSGKRTVGNVSKLKRTVSVARNFSRFFRESPGVDAINFVLGSSSGALNIWDIFDRLKAVGYGGDLTTLHFMMDIGLPCIKPDIVISRIFYQLGWLQQVCFNSEISSLDDVAREYTKQSVYRPINDLARRIVASVKHQDLLDDIGWVTDNPMREFDIFMVKYGQEPELQFGVMRKLFDASWLEKLSRSGHGIDI